MKHLGILAILFVLGCVAQAQDDLEISNIRIEMQTDVYGVTQQVIVGDIFNGGNMAYNDVTLTASVTDDETLVGEGFGYLVNQCGVALLDDALQPNETARFALPIDSDEMLSENQMEQATIDIVPSGTAIDPAPKDETAYTNVTPVSNQEVVSVEWQDDNTLRYGVGCDERIFTSYQWFEYALNTRKTTALIANPNALYLTDAVIQATSVTRLSANRQLENPALLDRSYFTYIPNTSKIVWQNDKHDLFVAERDGGTFRRQVHTILHQYSLRGFVFAPDGNFVAYYFGAYGEDVRYITVLWEGRLISRVLTFNTPSNTVPGLQNDGAKVIISGTFDGVTGYYLQSTISPEKELLFGIGEDELVGNHYPAPVHHRVDPTTSYVYIIRPIDGQATLQCYRYQTKTLTTLTVLPLNLQTDERAWAWLSPNGDTLAIGAKGRNGGLWLVDVDGCE
jgi:hypothetical protein